MTRWEMLGAGVLLLEIVGGSQLPAITGATSCFRWPAGTGDSMTSRDEAGGLEVSPNQEAARPEPCN